MSLFALGEERPRRCYSVAGEGGPSRGSDKIRDETASAHFQPSHLFCRARLKDQQDVLSSDRPRVKFPGTITCHG
jgi:hypothetical protein